jgi:hypothetical protein
VAHGGQVGAVDAQPAGQGLLGHRPGHLDLTQQLRFQLAAAGRRHWWRHDFMLPSV